MSDTQRFTKRFWFPVWFSKIVFSSRWHEVFYKEPRWSWPEGVYSIGNGGLSLLLADGTRGFYKKGKLLIRRSQLDSGCILMQKEYDENETDFCGTGLADMMKGVTPNFGDDLPRNADGSIAGGVANNDAQNGK